MPVPGPRDSRGILDAAGMRTVTTLTRHPPGEALDGVVDWFWAVTWDLPPGEVRVQRLLSMPASHLSVGTLDRAGRVLVPAGARVATSSSTTGASCGWSSSPPARGSGCGRCSGCSPGTSG